MNRDIQTPRTGKHLEELQSLVQDERRAPPIAKLIGFTATHVELGRATMELEVGEKHANPMGTLHGGVLCDVADAAMGFAMATTLEEDESFTTLDLNAKYFKPVWRGRLQASATVTRRTRTLGLIECDVTDEKGSLVAKLFSTCMVLRGKEAEGR